MDNIIFHSQKPHKKRRRFHQKSRNGCAECKRRRIKCDEMRPSCMRCVLLLNKCIYPSVPQFIITSERNLSRSAPSSPLTPTSLSPNCASPSERSSSVGIPTSLDLAPVQIHLCLDAADAVEELSDIDLYHHYLQHTSHTLSNGLRDQSALEIGMPTLALQSKTVLHSLLAVSATCIGCDMISKDPPPDVDAVNRVLMTGYRHYNLASERMRCSMSAPTRLEPQPLLASACLLMPFAAASQRLNHWISSRCGTRDFCKLLSTTPRDIIIITRGIRTTLQTLDSGFLGTDLTVSPEGTIDNLLATLEIGAPSATLPPSRTHVMVPILASTSQRAFSKLHERLESVVACDEDFNNTSLVACKDAFKILETIRANVFTANNLSSSSSFDSPNDKLLQPKTLVLQHVAPWLRSLADGTRVPLPDEPLTKFLLSFLVQTPKSYLDLVLPLLDQRLESPVNTDPHATYVKLTKERVLALDIYAHWSVLMFLIEDESWWIGDLPGVTLTGMLNRYGNDFVATLWPESCLAESGWWPCGMLNIWRQVKMYQ